MSVSIKVELNTNKPPDITASRLMNELQRRIQIVLMDLVKDLENIEENTTSKFIVDLKMTGDITTSPTYCPKNGGMYA